MNDKHLWELTDDFLAVQGMLDDPGEDLDAISDTLDAINLTLQDKLDGCCYYIQSQEDAIDAIDAEIKRLQARKKTFGNRVQRMRDYIRHQMTRLNDKSVETPYHTIRIQAGSLSVVVDDMSKIPEEYIRTKREVDKAALKKAAGSDEGVKHAGFHLQRGEPILVIK